MSDMLLSIQHNGKVFSPPVKSGVKIEWDRAGSPGKLTFTTVKIPNAGMSFSEGDAVCFYYKDKPVFMGYVFTKKRDRQHHIEVTCYDQIRYLKNKYTYVFENKTATEITKSLCNDFNLHTGTLEDTNYLIPAIAEENKSAIDIILGAINETLTNTGEMFVLYDDFGKLCLRNSLNMVSQTLIMETTAENFDYTSSIDQETYNSVVLYYKEEDNKVNVYSAYSNNRINQWGTLRYFEETKNKTIALNKAKALLQLYNRKTRELKVTGAFGDITVRGGTMIPVRLNLGDIVTNNYMLVQSVTHTFENDKHTMDLVLDGAWEDGDTTDMKTYYTDYSPATTNTGTNTTINTTTNTDNNTDNNTDTNTDTSYTTLVRVDVENPEYGGAILTYVNSDGKKTSKQLLGNNASISVLALKGSTAAVNFISNSSKYVGNVTVRKGKWNTITEGIRYETYTLTSPHSISIRWVT